MHNRQDEALRTTTTTGYWRAEDSSSTASSSSTRGLRSDGWWAGADGVEAVRRPNRIVKLGQDAMVGHCFAGLPVEAMCTISSSFRPTMSNRTITAAKGGIMADGADEDTLRRLIHLVEPTAHTGAGEYVPWSLLQALAAVIECDFVSFQVMNPTRKRVKNQTQSSSSTDEDGSIVTTGDDDGDIDLFWQALPDCAACSYPLHSADHHTVTQLSDFYSQREFRRTTMGAYAARAGWSREIMMPLPPDGENDRRLMFIRQSGPDFTNRDVLLLTLLRPHIYSLHLRQRYRNRGLPPLTARQMEILRMVAAGLSNGQIARALTVNEGTVAKHLENIFNRLSVPNRAAAAITWTHLNEVAQ